MSEMTQVKEANAVDSLSNMKGQNPLVAAF